MKNVLILGAVHTASHERSTNVLALDPYALMAIAFPSDWVYPKYDATNTHTTSTKYFDFTNRRRLARARLAPSNTLSSVFFLCPFWMLDMR